MKGYRFYLEYETPADKRRGTVKRPGPHTGNVVAVDLETPAWPGRVLALSSIFSYADSQVCWGEVSWDYLQANCRRIPEALARAIHPALFERLDAAEA